MPYQRPISYMRAVRRAGFEAMTTLGASSSSASLVWSSPVLIDRASLPPRPATSDGLRPAALWSRGSDSGSLYGSAEPPATCVQVRSPVHGVITLSQLQPDVTIGDLKALVAERIGLSPARRIHLSTWGHEMLDRLSLAQCRVKTNGVLDMRLSLVRLEDIERPTLERVRIFCTCLETRTLAVDRMTTVLDLKQRIQNFFACGEHEWYNKKVRLRHQMRFDDAMHARSPMAAQTTAVSSLLTVRVRRCVRARRRVNARLRLERPCSSRRR
jgi:hypothetical protein